MLNSMQTGFFATIRRHDMALVVRVAVLLEEEYLGEQSWRGVFFLPQGTRFDPGSYTMELDDRRSGAIEVLQTPVANHGSTRVVFRGSGPLA